MSKTTESDLPENGAEADPMARPLVDFALPGIVLAVLTGVFFFLPIDLTVEDWFHDEARGVDGWFLKDAEPLVMIYDKGLLPGLVVAVGAVVILLVGFRSVSWRRFRKVAVYLLLVMVIAPGLLVNAVMKEGWGRPRPRQVENFGGEERFERVWEYDGSSYGKSFPSGHAAMGFFFFGMYFLMRREGRGAVGLWLGVALGLGGLLGFTRMAQGGHFPSDVLWSAGVCYFVAAGLYYAMGLHRGLWYSGGRMSRGAAVGCVVALLGVSVLAVGTPYYEEKSYVVGVDELDGVRELRVKLELPRANLRISGGELMSIRAEAEGFGSPGSRLEDRFDPPVRDGDRMEVKLRQKKSGFFAAVEQPMSVVVPRGIVLDGDLVMEKGVVNLALSGEGFWDLKLGDVELTLVVPEGMALKVEFVGGRPEGEQRVAGLEWDEGKKRFKRGEMPVMKVRIAVSGGGRVDFIEGVLAGD